MLIKYIFKNKLFEKIDEAVGKLIDLKKQLAAHQAADGEELTAGGEKLLKTPRVTFLLIIKKLFKENFV